MGNSPSVTAGEFLDAAAQGDIVTARRFLKAGNKVNNTRAAGDWTALMFAAGNGHIDVVKLLIQKRADLNSQNSYGNTALIRAAVNGHADIIALLAREGADLNKQNKAGDTALISAAANNLDSLSEPSRSAARLAALRVLADAGADLDVRNQNGRTALIAAVDKGHGRLAAIELLIERGADMALYPPGDTHNNAQETVLDMARFRHIDKHSPGHARSVYAQIAKYLESARPGVVLALEEQEEEEDEEGRGARVVGLGGDTVAVVGAEVMGLSDLDERERQIRAVVREQAGVVGFTLLDAAQSE